MKIKDLDTMLHQLQDDGKTNSEYWAVKDPIYLAWQKAELAYYVGYVDWIDDKITEQHFTKIIDEWNQKFQEMNAENFV